MKYLLFHHRNLQFGLILNAIYSTKLNFKIICNGAIANGKNTNGEQHLVIKLKTSHSCYGWKWHFLAKKHYGI